MKKKNISLALIAALVFSVSAVVYAADGFTMTYRPGTTDAVTDLPDPDAGTGGEAYAVSSKIPQREGYEFIGWTLDYGVAQTYTLTYEVTGDPDYGIPGDTAAPDSVAGILAGSSVELANALTTEWTTADGTPPAAEDYTVSYVSEDGFLICPPNDVYGIPVGTEVTVYALAVEGYVLIGDESQTKTINQSTIGKWTFTGWCSDEACTAPLTAVTNISGDTTVYGQWKFEWIDLGRNEFTFIYKEEEPIYVSYTVRYIDIDTGDLILDDKVVPGVVPGTLVTENAAVIRNYVPIYSSIQMTIDEDGSLIVFMYFPYQEDNIF